jgi:hypothetical protein
MKSMNNFLSKSSSKTLGLGIVTLVLLGFCGCGKHESEGGVAGTATGALIGAAVSGRHDKGVGVAMGALVGNILGREIGKSADREEAKEEKEVVKQEVRNLKAQNRELKRDLARQSEKWCENCCRRVNLSGASICPYCGHDLIMEKFCRRCAAVFDADTPYRYCPYCRVGIHLSCR